MVQILPASFPHSNSLSDRHPNDPTITRAGYSLTRPLHQPPPVMNHRIRPPQPHYVLGWTFTDDELESLTGISHFANASSQVRGDWYSKWRVSSARWVCTPSSKSSLYLPVSRLQEETSNRRFLGPDPPQVVSDNTHKFEQDGRGARPRR